jgi:hypothetical protein
MKNVINEEAVTFELNEAIGHIQDLITEIQEGKYSPGAYCYATTLRHIYDHLNRSFQYADMADQDIKKITQKLFEHSYIQYFYEKNNNSPFS